MYNIGDARRICIDIESYDPDLVSKGPGFVYRDRSFVVGVAIAWQVPSGEIKSVYMPWRHTGGNNVDIEKSKDFLASLNRLDIELIGANIHYDLEGLRSEGLLFKQCIKRDIQIAEFLIKDTTPSYSLANLAIKYLGLKKTSDELQQKAEEFFGKKVNAYLVMHHLPANIVGSYACNDAELTLQVYEKQLPILQNDGLMEAFNLECDLIDYVQDVRWQGIRIDVERAEVVHTELQLECNKYLRSLEILSRNKNFNIWAQKDIEKAADELGLKFTRTDKDNASFPAAWLSTQPQQFWKDLHQARVLDRSGAVFVKSKILDLVHNGRLYYQLSQVRGGNGGAVSGRFACIAEGEMVYMPGEEKAIEKVQVGDYVYCYDESGVPRIKKVLGVFNHGQKECVKLIFDSVAGSGKITTLVCTPEHQIRSRKRGWVQAVHLYEGEKVYHMSRGLTGLGRTRICGAYGFCDTEEAFIKKEYYGVSSRDHIHHIDGNKKNNLLSNLKVLSDFNHRSLHSKERAKNPEHWKPMKAVKPVHKSGKDSHAYISLSKWQCLRELAQAYGRSSKVRVEFKTFKKKCSDVGIKTSDIAKRYSRKIGYISRGRILKAFSINDRVEQVSSYLGIDHRKLKELCAYYGIVYNHTLVSIISAGIHVVYDLEVEDCNCFIVNGVLAHNSKNPNMQQIPARNTYLAKKIRSLFLPEEKEVFFSVDENQAEIRMTVHYAKLLNLPGSEDAVQQYISNPDTDYHQWVAELTGISRRDAKTICFGILYSAGLTRIASELSVDTDKAKEVLSLYHKKIPFAKPLSDKCRSIAEGRGYIKTILGRRRHFDLFGPRTWEKGIIPKLYEAATKEFGSSVTRYFTHKALNSLIQGSSADLHKEGLRSIYKSGLPLCILPIHDEMNFSIMDTDSIVGIKEAILNHKLVVPRQVTVKYGPSFGELYDF